MLSYSYMLSPIWNWFPFSNSLSSLPALPPSCFLLFCPDGMREIIIFHAPGLWTLEMCVHPSILLVEIHWYLGAQVPYPFTSTFKSPAVTCIKYSFIHSLGIPASAHKWTGCRNFLLQPALSLEKKKPKTGSSYQMWMLLSPAEVKKKWARGVADTCTACNEGP